MKSISINLLVVIYFITTNLSQANVINYYYLFGKKYQVHLDNDILVKDESVMINNVDSEKLRAIIEKAKNAFHIDVPKGYVIEVIRAGVTKFLDNGNSEIWLWEVVISPRYTVKGEGETGIGPGEISIFITQTGKIITPEIVVNKSR